MLKARSLRPLKSNVPALVLSVLAVAAMGAILRAQGRVWWCKFGDYSVYVNQAWNSNHTSQHLFDPYSFTHILHGVAYFWLSYLIFPRLSVGWRFLLSILAAISWELFENTSYVVEKYRANTASLDYFGDSVWNSIGDVTAAAVGFFIASKIGRWPSLIFFVAVELALLLSIRDSLVLNIIMLIYPLDWVKAWQAAV